MKKQDTNLRDMGVPPDHTHFNSLGCRQVRRNGNTIIDTAMTPHTDTAPEQADKPAKFVLRQLDQCYKQTREQAQRWSYVSVVATVIGLVLIGIGAVAVLQGHIEAAIMEVVSSLITRAVAELCSVQLKEANERADIIQAKLTEALEVQTADEITDTIGDPKSCDKMKAEIVRKILSLRQESNADQ